VRLRAINYAFHKRKHNPCVYKNRIIAQIYVKKGKELILQRNL